MDAACVRRDMKGMVTELSVWREKNHRNVMNEKLTFFVMGDSFCLDKALFKGVRKLELHANFVSQY